jgi:tetratricopeptide (TPR) repeat protein
MKLKYFYTCLTILLFLISNSNAQKNIKKIDSLKNLIKNEASEKISLQRLLLLEYKTIENEDSLLPLFQKLLNQSVSKGEREEEGKLCIVIGNIQLNKDEFTSALSLYERALKIFTEIKKEDQIASSNNRIGSAYLFLGEYQKSLERNNLAVTYYSKVHDSEALASCYGNMGIAYKKLGKFIDAIEYQKKSYTEEQKTNNKHGMASCVNAIGNIYFSQGDYPNALKNYFTSLKLQKEAGYPEGIANALSNIGMVFKKQGELDKALKYSLQSYEIEKKHNRLQGMAISLSNIGDIYFKKNDKKNALDNFKQSLTLFEKINDEIGIADLRGSLGLLFESNKNYDSALVYHQQSLSIYEKTGQIDAKCIELFNIANCYVNQKRTDEAIRYLKQTISESKKNQLIENVEVAEELLATIYERKNNPAEALKHYKEFIIYRDSIFNIKKSDEVYKNEMKYEFELKAAEDSIENLHKQEILDSQIKAQKLEIEGERLKKYFMLAGIIILLIVAMIIFNRYKLTQKQKLIIENQKIEVEYQKQLVEEHQKEIKDSINYAKRIQSSFMASENEFKANLQDYFILFKPKDVVSGDFYWAGSASNHLYFCVADSTGHGIPGAFMSLLNISLLNEALLSKGLTETNELLDFVRKILIIGLKADESGQGGNDGMDCTMIRLNINKKEIQVSGANNPLWIIRDNNLIEIAVDKMPVGRSPKEHISFTSTTFQLLENDLIIMFTDGYADQFGGPKGKKYKYKQLNELLIEISDKTLNEQSSRLQESFNKWKGDLEQVDDVCVIGIRI